MFFSVHLAALSYIQSKAAAITQNVFGTPLAALPPEPCYKQHEKNQSHSLIIIPCFWPRLVLPSLGHSPYSSVLIPNDFWQFKKSNPPSKAEDFPSLRIIKRMYHRLWRQCQKRSSQNVSNNGSIVGRSVQPPKVVTLKGQYSLGYICSGMFA